MSPPRPGGEADKVGNRYELAWATWTLLQLRSNLDSSVKFEDPDPELGLGSELTLTQFGAREAHQVKRRSPSGGNWTVRALHSAGVIEAALHHATQGRDFLLVSQSPAADLEELAARARSSENLHEFTTLFLTKDLRAVFDELAAPGIWTNAAKSWATLRRFRVWHASEDLLRQTSIRIAEATFEGASGPAIVDSVAAVVLDNLGRTITWPRLLVMLEERGVRAMGEPTVARSHSAIDHATQSWLRSIKRTTLSPAIPRAESVDVLSALETHAMVVVHGAAGSGKSGILAQVVAALVEREATVLAFRIDRFGPLASEHAAGLELGLDADPVAALRRVSASKDAYLIIDQIDAVSLVSGRVPESADTVWDLIDNALGLQHVKVVVACRTFDLENDARLRRLLDPASTTDSVTAIQARPLPPDALSAALLEMGVRSDALTRDQTEFLRSPLHLALLQGSKSGEQDQIPVSRSALFDLFWEEKQRSSRARQGSVRFAETLAKVAGFINARKSLAVPVQLLDDAGLLPDVETLISENVLDQQGSVVAFFHESFFDYVFAREWTSRGESLIDFLLSDEQDLFRRAQVRQILTHLATADPHRHRMEAEALLLSDRTRFHMQLAAIGAIAEHPSPAEPDLQILTRFAEQRPQAADHVWNALARPTWIRVLMTSGTLAGWLDAQNAEVGHRAIRVARGASDEQLQDIARLLSERFDRDASDSWISDLAHSTLTGTSRAMFDLLLRAVVRGDFGPAGGRLWVFAHDLHEARPEWSLELLESHFIHRAGAMIPDDSGEIPGLSEQDHFAPDIIAAVASASPKRFAATFLPYVLDVMALTKHSTFAEMSWGDAHFAPGFHANGHREQIDEALFDSIIIALQQQVRDDPRDAERQLHELADSPFAAARFILYSTLAAAEDVQLASWAVELLDGSGPMIAGHLSDPSSATRSLIAAISPRIRQSEHDRLERRLLGIHPEHETPKHYGFAAFTLMACLDEGRLSSAGRRALAEYRRKFSMDSPPTPSGVVAGFVESPISAESAERMSDSQWRRAIAKYSGGRTGNDFLIGGADQLSSVLRAKAEADPARFAALAMTLEPGVDVAYLTGLLYAFGSGEHLDGQRQALFAAIRHLADLGGPSVNRALAFSIQTIHSDAPLEVVDLVIARALASDAVDDTKPPITRDGRKGSTVDDLFFNGLNTDRGSLILALSNLLISDSTGERTRRVAPHVQGFAGDPSEIVRTCAARLLASCLRHDRPAAKRAFFELTRGSLRVLATREGTTLMTYIGNVEPSAVMPTIDEMARSEDAEVRSAAGLLVVHAGLHWEEHPRLLAALTATAAVRLGVARACVARFDPLAPSPQVLSALEVLMNDGDADVQKAVSRLPYEMSGAPLNDFDQFIRAYVASPAFLLNASAMLHLLEDSALAIDSVVLPIAERIISRMGDGRTSDAGDAWQLSEIVVRALSQTEEAQTRSRLLDVLDRLLELNAFGVEGVIQDSERGRGNSLEAMPSRPRRRRPRTSRSRRR